MIGRNDPCLCGSGKKYKRCCLGKNEANVDTLIEEELERVLGGIYEQSRERFDITLFERHRKRWMDTLGDYWNEKSIEVAATEYFLYVARQDIWKQYLDNVLNGSLRDTVRSIVEKWQDPVILFGTVVDVQDGLIQVKEILGEETFYLEAEQDLEEEKGLIIFGVGLRNPRKHPNGLSAVTSFMFVKDVNQAFENDVVELAKTSKLDNDIEFYNEHMLDIYELMLNREDKSIDDLINTKLTEDQQEALDMVQEVLDDVDAVPEAKELLQNISITYFLKEQPRFRKPNVIAAAVFNVALDLKILGELTMTNSEVAKRFDVSTSSIKTHAERIHTFVVEMQDKTKEK
ncbi:YecA family protein [Sporosarcina pasteurii]|uniref:SWIM/SEC-C metal-binding motif protein, PBPRA1643 family n=1 Tax=Sporosarcina pasteurii TaxID=1474 RepID=A0A380BD27_SPOPA|nr:SEC-C domain-containing protein [Sporosarcina pasteurii]MDS9472378.1 SEC-C domain-containing protein [Sporosarcina pasteurii]QBQ06355.1 SEC-C domain-containing protein [Sporosarcina pasteurii]SUI98902.1 SWIM/SEC-C metal-binding motif protein, PBPRA1643 family [Sporosarcina pasteurii]